jgi:uncharacterized protein (DUF362 family)
MKRRDFLSKSMKSGLVAGVALSAGFSEKLLASSKTSSAGTYDMVAIKGGSPGAMFDKAITEMGGMGRFVKTGQTVVVKPNIGWDKTPEYAANTNPELVGKVIEHCFKAGAKTVYVFDRTCNEWTSCYKNSGIEDAVKKAGGTIVAGNTESNYKPVIVSKGKKLKDAKVHELIINSDVFINVPVLKSHSGATLTMGMKNHMGIVWDRGFWHRNDLHQCIADFATYKKPDLNILDAYRVMKRNGPQGVSVDDVILMKSMVLSTDIVALDTAGAKLFGMEPSSIPYIAKAAELGVGTNNLESISISRLVIE